MEAFLPILGVFVASFLLGSVPWGLVISTVFYNKDLRKVGSGNIGTTNAIRAMGKVGGYAVFVLDFGKGILSGFIGLWVAQACGFDVPLMQISLAVSFVGCIWGHVFSPWLGFKGGKGIAVGVGSEFVVLGPAVALMELALFIVLVVATRHVSVGSIAAAATCPLFALWVFWGNPVAWVLMLAAGVTIVWAHRGNIERLRNGTESRIGKK